MIRRDLRGKHVVVDTRSMLVAVLGNMIVLTNGGTGLNPWTNMNVTEPKVGIEGREGSNGNQLPLTGILGLRTVSDPFDELEIAFGVVTSHLRDEDSDFIGIFRVGGVVEVRPMRTHHGDAFITSWRWTPVVFVGDGFVGPNLLSRDQHTTRDSDRSGVMTSGTSI